ncbi:MAG TPA: ROK family protein, partial [Microbacteriaceae bacterium]|nr:ROK family protein [Microbacteriaceae bacterium]
MSDAPLPGIFEGSQNLAIGVDIGGTKIAAGIVDGEGRVRAHVRSATPATEPDALETEVVRLVRELSSEPLPVGVAAAGFIDAAQSEVMYAPNIAWRNVPLRAHLETRLGRTVTIDNDANAAGWAEYRFGAGRGVTDMTMITIGTGVGGAAIVNGRLLRGGFGAAAELGHVRLVPEGELCGCGQRGCLEQYGSGRALMRALNRIADTDRPDSRLSEVRSRDGELNAENVTPLMLEGDPGAAEALAEIGRALGAGCASIAAVLDPERF